MKSAEAVKRLENVDWRDSEKAHAEAERILLECVSPAIREAHKQLRLRCAYWAFS